MMNNLSVVASDPRLNTAAAALAASLQLPLQKFDDRPSALQLQLTPAGLQLSDGKQNILQDFTKGRLRYRQQQSSLRKESLARALGLHGRHPLHIVDATAGLGRDSFVLASLGMQVTAMERNPVVTALLADALRRAESSLSCVANIRLLAGDACHWLNQKDNLRSVHAVLLDPMYPHDDRRAAARKEMQLLQQLLGPADDDEALLEAALTSGVQRVVVKRPRLAPPLPGRKPSHEITGKSTRFDVYL